MDPEGKRIYGLIGYPVKHSLSPAMHNAAFSHLNINAEYRLFPLQEGELKGFLENLNQNNIHGLNVTIPYKEKVLNFVTLDPESAYLKQVKAVNTILRRNDTRLGFNTDILGFARHLKENIDPKDKKVAILGAGGAARAVAYVVSNLKAREIVVYDIDISKAQNLVNMIKGLFANADIRFVNKLEQLGIPDKNLLINATPIGLKDTDEPLIKKEMLHKGLFVYDLIYNPPETKLLAEARKSGAKTANGLGMLLYQGMLSFEIWTTEPAPQDIMRQALEKELQKCKR